MITLLHGDHIEASRAELLRAIAAAKDMEVRRIEGKQVDAAGLTQALESTSLFGGSTLVAIENLFSKLGKKQKLAGEYAAILQTASKGTHIIVWEEKEVSATILKSLGANVKAQLFKTPVVIFQFLDGLRPGDAKRLLVLYEGVIKASAAELVFAMLTKRIRQLLMLRDGVAPEGLQGWQAARLTNQAKQFSMEQLFIMHKGLLKIEFSLKTGATPFTLTQLTQQWLVAFE